MQQTVLIYMEQQHLSTHRATVLALDSQADSGRIDVILDQTIFYPQGGGQAWDLGELGCGHGRFVVEEVRFIDGRVHHYGVFADGAFAVGDTVVCRIDEVRRRSNSRWHSAGHLLDEAVKRLGYGWLPAKGIHYPGQAAVEYTGEVEDVEAARAALEAEANRLIQAGGAVRAEQVDVARLAAISDFVPPDLPHDKPVRVVTLLGDKGTPCGGTHVADIGDIGPLRVRYVKRKKGDIKVAYEIDA